MNYLMTFPMNEGSPVCISETRLDRHLEFQAQKNNEEMGFGEIVSVGRY